MKNIYMVQPNSIYGNSVYFPYAAGSLIAYAFTDETISREYCFKGFIYKKDDIDSVVSKLDSPFFIGFSCYVWNYEYNKALAKEIKKVFPDCKIAFGGHQINEQSEVVGCDYVDYIMLGEGEESFRRLLLHLCGKEKIENIPSLIHKTPDGEIAKTEMNPFFADRVSPYLSGLFDELVEKEPLEFSAILETNRGCPNRCAFCDWGNIKSRMKNFDMDMVKAEIDWMSEHKIEYCYCSDSNFGLFPRDIEIVEYVIQKHCENGYPQKFQATYSKNNPETVFKINKRLNEVGMSKGATLSFQSMSQEALNRINRKNMPLKNFLDLMSLYNANNIAAYSEIILGLPGETYESFRDGIEQLLECGQHMAINFFNCELLANSIMSDPEYIEKYKIEYAVTEQHQYHVVPNKEGIKEYSKIVVSTSTLTKEDWIACNILHVFVRAFHNLGLLQCVAIYLYYEKHIKYMDFYGQLIDWSKRNPQSICGGIFSWLDGKYREILKNGGSLTCYDPDFGELTWPLEEGSFLKVIKNYDAFYEEIREFVSRFIDDETLKNNMLDYQKAIVKNPYCQKVELDLSYDFYKFYAGIYVNSYSPLEKRENTISIDSSEVSTDLVKYARDTVWFGRKGGQNIIRKISYLD
ncbi:MAG: B12-binding domain-containing radical SAM protein [Acutalibacteraceae bacterium]